MSRAVILHGTDGNPEENWFPWLRGKLEDRGYEVWVPQLPECHTPNREVYANFLLKSGWDFTGNIVVGHSSGAVEVLNILDDDRFPKLKLAVAVSAWAKNEPNDNDEGRLGKDKFANLFPLAGFDFTKMQTKAADITFLHSADDPYCPLEQATYLAEELHAPLTTIEHGGHIGSNFPGLPQIWEIIESTL